MTRHQTRRYDNQTRTSWIDKKDGRHDKADKKTWQRDIAALKDMETRGILENWKRWHPKTIHAQNDYCNTVTTKGFLYL